MRKRRSLICCLAFLVLVCVVEARSVSLAREAVVREGPNPYYGLLKRLPAGSQVEVVAREKSWSRIRGGGVEGWVANVAFSKPRAGRDYDGLLNRPSVKVISPTDLTAATKGLVEAKYTEAHSVSMKPVDWIDAIVPRATAVRELMATLKSSDKSRVLAGLPRREFNNKVILRHETELLLGRSIAAKLLDAGLFEEPALHEYCNTVAAVVGTHTERYDLRYRVGILDDPGINGFGLPGGYVLLSRGLLRELRNESELACVLAHEMAHASLHHGTREFGKRSTHRGMDSMFAEMEQDLTGGSGEDEVTHDLEQLITGASIKNIGVKRGRADELEADVHGVIYAAAAGYDAQAMIALLERIERKYATQDKFLNHPSIAVRIQTLRRTISQYRLANRTNAHYAERFKEKTRGRLDASQNTD